MASQHEIARHLDVSVTRLRQLIAGRSLPKSGTLDEYRSAYLRRLTAVAADRSRGSLAEERAKLTAKQAEKLDLELTALRFSLMPARELPEALSIWAHVVASHLRTIPPAVGRDLGPEAERLMGEHIDRVLNALKDEMRERGIPETEADSL